MIDEMLKMRVERALGNAADASEVRIGAGDLRTLLRDLEDALHDVEESEQRYERRGEWIADLEGQVHELQCTSSALQGDVNELTAQVALQEEVIREANA